MKNLILLGFSFILIMLLFFSCKQVDHLSNKTNIEQLSMEKIKQNLESGNSIERQNPFVERKFDPYLNGEWIGDAVSYGCYRKGQAPGEKGPSKAEILEDLKIISQYWNLIRVYNADDDTERILQVIHENNLPIKVIVGIWLEREINNPELKKDNIKNAMRGIALANKYQKYISSVSVGNEALVFWSAHRMNPDILIRYIRAVRNNANVPVTVADDYNFWNNPESKKVADELDFIITHIYPLWNGKNLDNAIEWMDSVYFLDVKKMHPNKVLVLGEIGWATTYNAEKVGPGEQGTLIKAEVSLKAQEKFLIKLDKWINEKKVVTFLFEAFDEPWKGGGDTSPQNEIEKHWGVFYENRTPKESFRNFLKYKSVQ